MRTRLLCGLLPLLMTATVARAQQVTVDPTTGETRISYSVDGANYTVVVPAADRIAPKLTLVDLQISGDVAVYVYRLENELRSPAEAGRGILTAIVVCPAEAQDLNGSTGQPLGWRLQVYRGENGLAECQFEAGLQGILEPGAAVEGLQIRSHALPGTADVEVVGVAGGARVASGEDTPDSVYRLINAYQGRGRMVRTVTPSRLPSQISSSSQTIAALQSDLQLSCDSLGWIQNLGTCRSLSAKAEAAARAIERGQPSVAKNQLSAFRAELDAQRGKHVNDNAYFLLSVTADRTLSLMH